MVRGPQPVRKFCGSQLVDMAVFLKQVINILPILITAVLLPFDVSAASIAQKVYCRPGQQLEEGLEDANEHCAPCPPGFYQDRNHHRITSCHKCASFSDYDARRRLVENCTPYHDTVVRCVEGFYYVYDPIGGDCLTCTNCPSQGKYEIQACSDTENAICCDKEDMMVKNGTCVGPLVCGPGQFLVPAQADREEECKQCGLESSNPEVHHRKRSCGQTQDATDTDGEEQKEIKPAQCTRHPELASTDWFSSLNFGGQGARPCGPEKRPRRT
ncbi:hypothetical protein RRG08_041444 [Elysia crispata]|uniref:TNFR-Cys domain-containing protein n=1 Tax=Elysia crispata TaxID=231223 RepID=A0AAE0Z1V4_9GAST|nr:hypothetical protein RRG08_041444 [Elysia crispata]